MRPRSTALAPGLLVAALSLSACASSPPPPSDAGAATDAGIVGVPTGHGTQCDPPSYLDTCGLPPPRDDCPARPPADMEPCSGPYLVCWYCPGVLSFDTRRRAFCNGTVWTVTNDYCDPPPYWLDAGP